MQGEGRMLTLDGEMRPRAGAARSGVRWGARPQAPAALQPGLGPAAAGAGAAGADATALLPPMLLARRCLTLDKQAIMDAKPALQAM
jgi:hypothetical protein